jgi:hypothetical protein
MPQLSIVPPPGKLPPSPEKEKMRAILIKKGYIPADLIEIITTAQKLIDDFKSLEIAIEVLEEFDELEVRELLDPEE